MILLILTLFLFNSVMPMESTAGSTVGEPPCSAYEHPLHDVFDRIIAYAVHQASVEDLYNIRLTCKLFAGEAIRFLTSEDKEEIDKVLTNFRNDVEKKIAGRPKVRDARLKFRQFRESRGNAWYKIQLDEARIAARKEVVQDFLFEGDAYLLKEEITEKDLPLFKMVMCKLIGFFDNPGELLFELARSLILRPRLGHHLRNLLTYVFTMTMEEQKRLLEVVESYRKIQSNYIMRCPFPNQNARPEFLVVQVENLNQQCHGMRDLIQRAPVRKVPALPTSRN